jgi:NitT/TauT family transport system substrate-binding protein
MIRPRTSRSRLSLIGALFLFLTLVAAACGSDSSEETTEETATTAAPGAEGERPAPEKEKITVGLPVLTPAWVPLYLANAEGYFAEEGIEVELVHFQGGSEVVSGIVSGSVDMAVGALAELALGYEAGQPLKGLYGAFNMPVFEFYAVDGIDSVEAGKGKAWGITRAGSSTDFLTRFVIEEAGLNPSSDVNIVQGGRSAERMAAMAAGQIDVNIFAPPETFIAEEAGYKKILTLADVLPEYPYGVTYASESFISDNPGTVEAFLRGLVRGIETVQADPELAAQVIVDVVEIEEKYALETVESFVDQYAADGALPNEDDLATFWEIGVKNGTVKAPIATEDIFDLTWMDSFDEWRP